MPSSDSEDFESADEGNVDIVKKDRKKRLSSSNYSNDALESEKDVKSVLKEAKLQASSQETPKVADGWDDFDIDDNDDIVSEETKADKAPEPVSKVPQKVSKQDSKKSDDGWDTFDDWGDDDIKQSQQLATPPQGSLERDIGQAAEKLASVNVKNTGWGWGWGVDSLLSTATAGISTITSQVSQGLTTVLESGIGAPDPEELARKAKEVKPREVDVKPPSSDGSRVEESSSSDGFQLGSLLSGVTKFVETTSTKVIAGGLDTLETIGKKTMEVLQDGDPGLAKKRAMLGLDAGDKPVLSQVLREAKARADEEDRIREEKREAKEVHYENLFDDFEGLVHLEALEMLSKQVTMRIEERIRTSTPEKRQEIKETLQQVSELCEMPEDEEDDDETDDSLSKPDALHERLQTATQDLGLKLQFQPVVKQYTEILNWLTETSDVTEKNVYKRAVGNLAQATALSVEIYHKAAEMLLVKTRRSTADESDALTQMTVVLTKHISELATLFTEKLNSLPCESKEQINTYITNIFLEAGNSSTYIQNAFQLALPILQIGAV